MSSSQDHNPLTPPETPHCDDVDPVEGVALRVSTTFHPDAPLDPSAAQDVVIVSADGVLFYVHTQILLYASKNAFSGLLPAAPRDKARARALGLLLPAVLAEKDAPVLGLVLHALYGLTPAEDNPDLALLSLALDALLVHYAVPPEFALSPGRPLFETLLAHAAVRPLHVYSLAGHYELEALAVAASPHLLSFPLFLLSDDDAVQMGPVYLRRLFFLHLGRLEALKRLLTAPPSAHAPSVQCDAAQQQRVQRAWRLAAAAITYDACAGTPVQALEATLGPLLTHLLCAGCRAALMERTHRLLVEWSAIRKTI